MPLTKLQQALAKLMMFFVLLSWIPMLSRSGERKYL